MKDRDVLDMYERTLCDDHLTYTQRTSMWLIEREMLYLARLRTPTAINVFNHIALGMPVKDLCYSLNAMGQNKVAYHLSEIIRLFPCVGYERAKPTRRAWFDRYVAADVCDSETTLINKCKYAKIRMWTKLEYNAPSVP